MAYWIATLMSLGLFTFVLVDFVRLTPQTD
jgi:hypothetical protein